MKLPLLTLALVPAAASASNMTGLYHVFVTIPTGLAALVLFLLIGHLWLRHWNRRHPKRRAPFYIVEIFGFILVPLGTWFSFVLRVNMRLYGWPEWTVYVYHAAWALIPAFLAYHFYLVLRGRDG